VCTITCATILGGFTAANQSKDPHCATSTHAGKFGDATLNIFPSSAAGTVFRDAKTVPSEERSQQESAVAFS
jgi:hypothetical protein